MRMLIVCDLIVIDITRAMEGKSVVYPECVNGKEARMVCLSGECGLHPFFCTNCEEPSC